MFIGFAAGLISLWSEVQFLPLAPAFSLSFGSDERQLQTFMAHSLDEFCDAAKFRHGFVVRRDELAGAEPHQFAERTGSFAKQQQRFLPAQNAVKTVSVGRAILCPPRTTKNGAHGVTRPTKYQSKIKPVPPTGKVRQSRACPPSESIRPCPFARPRREDNHARGRRERLWFPPAPVRAKLQAR